MLKILLFLQAQEDVQNLSNRPAILSEIKQRFTRPTYAVVHWDGKIIKDSTDQNKEHVIVAISGSPNFKYGKLLGVEKTESSSGVNQANAASNLLEVQ